MISPLVVIVAPERPRNVNDRERFRKNEDLRLAVQRAAESRKWRTRTFRAYERLSTRPAENRRRMMMLGGWDAADIYNLAHRDAVAVLQVGGSVRVLPHPRQDPSLDRTMALEDFVRHKAFFSAVSEHLPFESALNRFEETLERVECEGERDPRCLPMHIFAPRHDHALCALTDAVAVKKKYGPPTARADHRGRVWESPKGRHGGSPLWIRGKEIGAGFHWDVAGVRNTSELTTTTEIWSMPPGSYLNVTPNAAVRKGQSSAQASAKRTVTLVRDAVARKAAQEPQSPPRPSRRGRKR